MQCFARLSHRPGLGVRPSRHTFDLYQNGAS